MTARIVGAVLLSLVWTPIASAETVVLSDSAIFLGRIDKSEINGPLHLTVDLNDDVPVATYVVARFQNNSPKRRLPGGGWVPWPESEADLIDTGFQPDPDGTLTFELMNEDLPLDFSPVVITLSYAVEGGSLKSGYVVVD